MANEQNSEMIDLDFNMEEVDLTRPVAKAGTYDATIGFTRKDTKNDKEFLLVGYRLAQEAESIKGDKINKGFTITQRILLQPTGKLTKAMIDERLARINFAATGEKTGKPNTGNWLNKPVRVVVQFRDEEKEVKDGVETGRTFPPRNEVANVYAPPQTQEAKA